MRSLIGTLLVCFTVSAFGQTADTVLLHGKVYTGDPGKFAQAIAISGKKIVAVGTDEEISKLIGSSTEKLDLGKQLVVPGLNNAQARVTMRPAFIRLATTTEATWDNVKAALQWATDESSSERWILGEVGPQVLNDPNATSAALEAVAKGRKIMLSSPTGHAGLWSDSALSALRAGSMSDPLGGRYEHDKSGRINGKAFEYAQYVLEQKLADAMGDDEAQQAIRDFSARALAYGVTSVQSMSLLPYSRFHRALLRVGTPLRVREIELAIPPEPSEASHPVEYVVDGTPVEHGAAISGTYPSSEDTGALNLTSAQITAIVAAAKKSGQQPLFHAVGDRAIRVLFDALTAAGVDPSMRVRVEYGDGLSGDLIPTAAKLGIVVVQNPAHFQFKPLYPATHPYLQVKTLVANKIPFALGSDASQNPWLDLMLTTTLGSEALTVAQALDAYTRGGAYAEMAEKDKGAIAPGQLADIAVLSRDIFTSPVTMIPDTHAIATMIDGKWVYGKLGRAQ